MLIVDVEQGSQEWLEMRLCKITSTDSASIIGVNPFKTAHELWNEKMKKTPSTPMNLRMKRGQDLEPIARDLLINKTGIDFKPTVAIHDVEYWAMASLDGISACKRFVCEIKAPSWDTHQLAIEGEIKEYYRCQCMHHLFVTGAEKCYYFSYNPDVEIKTALVEIYPDQEYITNMVAKEREFYEEYLIKDIPPPGPWNLRAQQEQ